MKKLLRLFDPHRQSFFHFKWGFWSALFCFLLLCGLLIHAQSNFVKAMLSNMFLYLPNYLIEEFSQRFWCSFTGPWWCYVSGSFTEILIPLVLCLWMLRLRGGRYLLPVFTYWLATAMYDVGLYVADARAGQLKYTSKDMLTVYEAGTVKGDWYHALNSVGLLEYDLIIGKILIYCAVICLFVALYSLWYYWTHHSQYVKNGRWH